MNKLTYPLLIWKNHRGFALFSVVIIAALQFLIVQLMTSIDTAPIIAVLLQQLPERFQTFVNEAFLTRLSVKGAAAFGFNHPFVLALLAINAINIPNRHIAGEIETGTLELILAYPVHRIRLFISLWLSGSLILLLIILGALTGSLSAIAFAGKFTVDFFVKMVQIGINLWLLFLLVMSYTLLLSTFGKEGSKIGVRSAGVTLVFFLLNLLSALWSPLKFIQPFNIFTYFQPQDLMFDQANFWLNASVLLGLIAVCFVISLRQFHQRDIPG